MKKVKCACEDCERVERWTTGAPRGPQYVEVRDDFDEKKEKAFCSITCACYAGYMTLNKQQFEELKGKEVNGYWWLKDPSGGTNKEYEGLPI